MDVGFMLSYALHIKKRRKKIMKKIVNRILRKMKNVALRPFRRVRDLCEDAAFFYGYEKKEGWHDPYVPPLPSMYKKREKIWCRFSDEDEDREYPVHDFEMKMNVYYISSLEAENKKAWDHILYQCRKAKEKGYIPMDSFYYGKLYEEKIRQGEVHDVMVRWTGEEMGYGLFARGEISEGDFIGEYTGVIKKCRYWRNNLNDYCFRYPTAPVSYILYAIDAQLRGNEMRFINHSSDPNAETVSLLVDDMLHIGVRALRKIPSGEQITFDYGSSIYIDKRL
jgi:hypothetical protein